MATDSLATRARTFKCVFGHDKSQLHMCADFELSPFGHLDNLSHWGFFEPNLRAHFIRNKRLPASEFRSYFNSRGRLTRDEQKAVATSPRLTKTQAKKMLKEYHLRNYLLADIPNLLRHDILPEITAAWGDRILTSLSAQDNLPTHWYRKLFEYQPTDENAWRELYLVLKDEEEAASVGRDVRYPEHWEVLATNPATPDDLLIELHLQVPQLGWEMLFQRGHSLPISLYFAIPDGPRSRDEAFSLMSRREDEVKAWIEQEHPDMAEVPLEWVFEVLSPREW